MLLIGVGQEVGPGGWAFAPVVVDHSGETWQFGQVRGVSTTEIGVYGYTDASEHCGVFGHSPAGIGVKGASNGTDGVQGWTSAPNASGVFGYSYVAAGVTGWSSGNDGLVGISTSTNPDHAALRARNEGSGPAIVCEGDLIVTGAIQGGGISQFLEPATSEDIAGLETRLDEIHADVSVIDDIIQWNSDLGGNVDGLEVKLDRLGVDFGELWNWLDNMFDWLRNEIGTDIAAAEGRIKADIAAAEGRIKADIAAAEGRITANIAANAAAIGQSSNLVVGLFQLLRYEGAANNRVEEKLNQLLGALGVADLPRAPDSSKITLRAFEGTRVGVDPSEVEELGTTGQPGAVDGGALVTVYCPNSEPMIAYADRTGAFFVGLPSQGQAFWFGFVEVTQTNEDGNESARVRIPDSSQTGG